VSVSWGDVVGQSAAVAALRAALAAAEVGHAWLFVGPEGVGSDALARNLAAALNCETIGPGAGSPDDGGAADEGCGQCGTCRRIASGSHLSSRTFEPVGAWHRVEDVRGTWIPEATRTLPEGRRRVLRVARADRMNEATQNAFLKMLEEPPLATIWVLDARDTALLLDTVVSRCRRVDLVPWRHEDLVTAAEHLGFEGGDADALAAAALGSPDRLRRLADEPGAHDRHLDVVGRLVAEGPGAVVAMSREIVAWGRERARQLENELAGRLDEAALAFGVDGPKGTWPPGVKKQIEDAIKREVRHEPVRCLHQFCDDLASWLRDLLVAGSATELVNRDRADQVAADVVALPRSAIVTGLAAVEECREAIDRNGQPQLHVERLLMSLALPIWAEARRHAA
jgi:DNA polymerase-3 subunit delta'